MQISDINVVITPVCAITSRFCDNYSRFRNVGKCFVVRHLPAGDTMTQLCDKMLTIFDRGQNAHFRCKADNEEADKLAGKYGSRSGNASQMCRFCTCPTNYTDRCMSNHRRKTVPMIKDLVRKKDRKELKLLCSTTS